MKIGYNTSGLIRIPVIKACDGYYLRWYYNGWHYWFFLPGTLGLLTEGEKYRTIGTRSVLMGSGQITGNQCAAIRTIMNTREVYLLTTDGWKNIRIEPGSINIYDNRISGYEIEIKAFIGSKEISYNDYSPIDYIPIIPPTGMLCEIVICTQVWECKNYDTNYPASKVYDDDEANRAIYGGLYSFAQIHESGFAPIGWHMPTLEDFSNLIMCLGDISEVLCDDTGEEIETNDGHTIIVNVYSATIAGGKLKEVGTAHWDMPDAGNNSSGFTGLGSGYWNSVFTGLKSVLNLWTADEKDAAAGYAMQLSKDNDDIRIIEMPKTAFLPVRLLKDIPASSITDFDGNIYHTIIIGTQEWMIENLKTTHYADGTPIPNLTINGDWAADITGAYCYYNNDISNKAIFGNLYNWFAVNKGNLAPTGWRVPSLVDFQILGVTIGGMATEAAKLRKIGPIYWFIDDGTDNYGFAAVANGHRTDLGTWGGDGPPVDFSGGLWTTTEYNAGTAWYILNNGGDIVLHEYMNDKPMGYAVRCMRDI